MSTLQNQNTGHDEAVQMNPEDERQALMARARMMGIEFSNNIGTDTLRQRINDKMEGKPEVAPEAAQTVNPLADPAPQKVRTLRQMQHDEQMKLVRIRIQCLDPKKKDLPGEILTVANEFLGTVKKYVPYGEHTEDGYHVPYCIYRLLDSRKFLNIRTVKDRRTGIERVESTWAKEFAIEVLPQLTAQQIKDLATAQTAAGSLN
ncbi:hypothetical protein [Erwinia phage phiEaP8]|uniref:Uncharacterized protein n=2 Tax=Caudoviricetes TaxID=2731619 RepID=A0A3G1QTL9_9CAUD|nr:hypothetical protein HYP64_gp16 [Erwinia phage phiEaP8]AWN06205.1 hypothetical protein [Erwinia phage phiEaP8]